MSERLLIISFVLLLVVAGCFKPANQRPQYSEEISVTYKKPYIALKDELLYARITGLDEAGERKTLRPIRNKEQLLEIVKGFDKLKSITPIEYEHNPEKTSSYVVVMWREGKSVSYVIQRIDSTYYYQPSPDFRHVAQMPSMLVETLGF